MLAFGLAGPAEQRQPLPMHDLNKTRKLMHKAFNSPQTTTKLTVLQSEAAFKLDSVWMWGKARGSAHGSHCFPAHIRPNAKSASSES